MKIMDESYYGVNIKALNPNAFRSGEWAKIKKIVWYKNALAI